MNHGGMTFGALVISPVTWSRSLKTFFDQPVFPLGAFCAGSFSWLERNFTLPRILMGLMPGIRPPAHTASERKFTTRRGAFLLAPREAERRVPPQLRDGLRQLGDFELLQLADDLLHLAPRLGDQPRPRGLLRRRVLDVARPRRRDRPGPRLRGRVAQRHDLDADAGGLGDPLALLGRQRHPRLWTGLAGR